jgi:hypothetical protein
MTIMLVSFSETTVMTLNSLPQSYDSPSSFFLTTDLYSFPLFFASLHDILKNLACSTLGEVSPPSSRCIHSKQWHIKYRVKTIYCNHCNRILLFMLLMAAITAIGYSLLHVAYGCNHCNRILFASCCLWLQSLHNHGFMLPITTT